MKTIKIIIEWGVVQDIEGLPKGYNYFVDDHDNQDSGSEPLICTEYACTEPQGEEMEFCKKHYK